MEDHNSVLPDVPATDGGHRNPGGPGLCDNGAISWLPATVKEAQVGQQSFAIQARGAEFKFMDSCTKLGIVTQAGHPSTGEAVTGRT